MRRGLHLSGLNSINVLKHCQRREFPQDNSPKTGTAGKQERETFGQDSSVQAMEEVQMEQQEGARLGETDLGDLSGQKFPL